MSAKSLIEVLKEIEKQLNWKGPNGKVMGHVVIPRSKAEILFSELSALSVLSDEVKNDVNVRCTQNFIEFRSGDEVIGFYDKNANRWSWPGDKTT